MQALDGTRVNISSVGLGTAWEALRRAIQYMDERSQFKTKLKDFQHLRFKIAEETTKLASSRLMLRQAAQMIDNGYQLRSAHLAMAKLHVAEST